MAEIRKLWGVAKSPELKLSDEELHLLVQAHTGKDSIRELDARDRRKVFRVLLNLKDSAKQAGHARDRPAGNPATENQRKKIRKLAQELGWDSPSRVNGMCRRMFGIGMVEWLNGEQCSKLIEALKSMVERKGGNT